MLLLGRDLLGSLVELTVTLRLFRSALIHRIAVKQVELGRILLLVDARELVHLRLPQLVQVRDGIEFVARRKVIILARRVLLQIIIVAGVNEVAGKAVKVLALAHFIVLVASTLADLGVRQANFLDTEVREAILIVILIVRTVVSSFFDFKSIYIIIQQGATLTN